MKVLRLGQLELPVRMAAWTENFTCHRRVPSSPKAFPTQHIETKFRQIKGRRLTRKTCQGFVAIICANKATEQGNAKQLKNNEQKAAESLRTNAKKTLHYI